MLGRAIFVDGEARVVNCPNCQSPERILFGPGQQPELVQVRIGNWISLEQCEPCHALWCLSPYEPYASFSYLVRWPSSVEVWAEAHEKDDGKTMRQWHASEIRNHWRGLPEAEREEIEFHRRRSYGHNPIDAPKVFGTAGVIDLF